MMNGVLKDVVDKGVVIVFIGDILLFMEDEEHHEKIVEVLKRLEENDLFLKPERCKFKKREVEFLGMIIGDKG